MLAAGKPKYDIRLRFVFSEKGGGWGEKFLVSWFISKCSQQLGMGFAEAGKLELHPGLPNG